MTQTVDDILTERGARYGLFKDHAELAVELKRIMHDHRPEGQAATNFSCMKSDQQEALDMIQHKVARIINGDPDYADSWQDIAGYAQLVADRLNGKVR